MEDSAARPGLLARLLEVGRYRDLVRNLVSRDLKVRYRESFVGFGWSMLNPLLMTSVFYLVFHVFLGNPTPNVPGLSALRPAAVELVLSGGGRAVCRAW